jgi:hypothetical protein
MEKISLTDHVRNEEVLFRVNEQRNVLHEMKISKVNWIGQILRGNCLLKHIVEGKIEVTRRRARRRKQLVNDVKEKGRVLEFERGSNRSLLVENSLWKRLWVYRKTGYGTSGRFLVLGRAVNIVLF